MQLKKRNQNRKKPMSEQKFSNCVLIGKGAVATADNQLVIALDPNPDNQARLVMTNLPHLALIDRYVRQAGRESNNPNIIMEETE